MIRIIHALDWYLQRVTGALLLVLLVGHFWVEHYIAAPQRRGQLTYEVILSRVSNPYWQIIDIGFLLVALYHGLNGVRGMLLDYSRVGRTGVRVCTFLLVVVGLLWAYWGIEAFKNL